MEYEDIEDDKLPQAVQDKMLALIQMESDALIEEVRDWGGFYRRWATLSRRRTQSERLSHINDGTFVALAAEYESTADDTAGTLMTAIWCMPDEFLDSVITIHRAIEAVQQQQ